MEREMEREGIALALPLTFHFLCLKQELNLHYLAITRFRPGMLPNAFSGTGKEGLVFIYECCSQTGLIWFTFTHAPLLPDIATTYLGL
jgi:hypothetical protein